jgi:3'-phosphoadenosine 5'-phosphosulfate sulfotransferase (PAPS reductase)/FAD synthetase
MSEPTKSQIMASQLKQYQALSLNAKVTLSKKRMQEWLDHWEDQCYVAFSGGKDSTVLLHLVWSINPRIPAVFVDTGLEYPEIREFVKTFGDRVVWLKPKMPFTQVIEKYGYPVVSKEQSQFLSEIRTTKSEKLKNIRMNGNKSRRGKVSDKWKFLINAPFKISDKCCDVMKKHPCKQYEKETGRVPFLGTMACESQLRQQKYHREGCNGFDAKRPTSTPMSFWEDQDVWHYISSLSLSYASIYDKGEDRTGCMFCMFGCHKDAENRFQRMYHSHPKQWSYCINQLGCGKVLDYIGVKYVPEDELF